MDAHGLFIHHLLKGVLAASQSGRLSTKLLHMSVCRLRVDVSFHLLWANAKEHACGIAWYECAQVRTRPPRWLPGGGESLAPRPRGAWRRRCPRRGCADGGAAVSRCSHLQLPGGTGCEAPFLVLIRRLRVFRAVSVTAGVPGPQVHGRWTAGGRAELCLCHRSLSSASGPHALDAHGSPVSGAKEVGDRWLRPLAHFLTRLSVCLLWSSKSSSMFGVTVLYQMCLLQIFLSASSQSLDTVFHRAEVF